VINLSSRDPSQSGSVLWTSESRSSPEQLSKQAFTRVPPMSIPMAAGGFVSKGMGAEILRVVASCEKLQLIPLMK
jgi:hypothetical protein